MSGKMDCAGDSRAGTGRQVNEDHFLIAELKRSMQVVHTSLDLDDSTRLYGGSQGQLLLVADGMGGLQEGRQASLTAVEETVRCLLNAAHSERLRPAASGNGASGKNGPEDGPTEDDGSEDGPRLLATLAEGVHTAQQRLRNSVRSRTDVDQMGTTLTLAYVVWPAAWVVHVGDSRCYRLRDGRLAQVTHDHTAAARAEAAGDRSDASMSHRLTNAIAGTESDARVETHRLDLRLGDRLLLCSDGVSGVLDEQAIVQALGRDESAAAICGHLLDAVASKEGRDDATAVVATFAPPGAAAERSAAAAARPQRRQAEPARPLAMSGADDPDPQLEPVGARRRQAAGGGRA